MRVLVVLILVLLLGCTPDLNKRKTNIQTKRSDLVNKIRTDGPTYEEIFMERAMYNATLDVWMNIQAGFMNMEDAEARIKEIEEGKIDPDDAEPPKEQEEDKKQGKDDGKAKDDGKKADDKTSAKTGAGGDGTTDGSGTGKGGDGQGDGDGTGDGDGNDGTGDGDGNDGDGDGKDGDGDGKDEETEKELSELDKRLTEMEKAIGRKELPKFTLSPDRTFQSFALGANFDLIDGLANNSLYADVMANFRRSKAKYARLSFQLGTTRGRNTAPEEEGTTREVALRQAVMDPVDSTFSPRWIRINTERNRLQESVTNLTTVYARMNYRLNNKDTKWYLTGQVEYASFDTDITIINSAQITDTTTVEQQVDGLPLVREIPAASDTIKFRDKRSYYLPALGYTLFNETEAFDLTFTMLMGPRLQQGNVSDGVDTFVLLTQAALLEKKLIGAKLGFEMRYFTAKEITEPSYFFYLSKQFSMEEFFKIFSSKGG